MVSYVSSKISWNIIHNKKTDEAFPSNVNYSSKKVPMRKQCQIQVSHGDKNEPARNPFLKNFTAQLCFPNVWETKPRRKE